ncbi:MAG: nitroreductase family protein [Deltaproteobacteria bacterium]|nr:nitroreductase family protein [Deltaproteobacteria bacterium]
MKLDETIKGRRSIRKYQDVEIPDSVIEELLDLALHTPSSMNGQPWHFIVVRRQETKTKLAEIKNRYCPVEKQMYRADFLKDAPVIIVVCVDKNKSYDREVENAVLATLNILLGAFSRGIGTVYMSAYKPDDSRISEEIRKALRIPMSIAPITIIPLGYPDETPEPKTIRDIKGAISYESY